jgi:phosphoglycerate kinase
MSILYLKDVELKDKVVLVRTGFDVPVEDDGGIRDDRRIQAGLPTIEHILSKEPRQVVLFWHMGRPKAKEDKLRTDRAAERLAELLGQPVRKVDDWGESGLPEDRIVALENLRFNPLEKHSEVARRDELGRQLASLGDIFVQDAFSNAHHDDASMVSVPKFVKSCAGPALEKEIESLVSVLENPARPFVSIIGGLKAGKLNVISNLLPKVDRILVGGALAFTVLKGLGYEVGASKIDNQGVERFHELIEAIRNEPKVVLPVDAVVANDFSDSAEHRVVGIEDIPEAWMALDIGPDSVKLFTTILKEAKTVTWNGPIGAFEIEAFSHGTRDVAIVLAELDATTIIGGGDSAEAIEQVGLSDKVSHISTGGGASLMVLEGKKLPAITALEQNYQKYQ